MYNIQYIISGTELFIRGLENQLLFKLASLEISVLCSSQSSSWTGHIVLFLVVVKSASASSSRHQVCTSQFLCFLLQFIIIVIYQHT